MSDTIDKERSYWQGLAALPDTTLSATDYQMAYLIGQGGVAKTSVSDMMNQLYGGDYPYWYAKAGSPSGSRSVSDLKRMVLG